MKIPARSNAPVRVIPYQQCLAKTYRLPGGRLLPGRTVVEHCQIVGEVGRALLERLPACVQHLLPEGSPLCCAAHDTGKVSPTFAEKIFRACRADGAVGLPRLGVDPDVERTWGGHATVSQVAVEAMGAPRWVPEILGQHHGFSPNTALLQATGEKFGGVAWQQERVALVEELKRRLALSWPVLPSPERARLLAGLVVVSDWIGSGDWFADPAQPWRSAIGRALDEAGFALSSYRHGLSFKEVCGYAPRAVQSAFAEEVTAPGVYVLEAPMGIGKTEAAFYAAYRMLERGEASGIYFALPTQVTSDKIHERFNAFLGRILSTPGQSALLLHSAARFKEYESGRAGSDWFRHAKRGLLAPFAVGTVDQALMAVLNVKHGAVRAFGLAGKVVILDEVHSYDAFTGSLIDALVALLRALGCTVIILSATLTQKRRAALAGARTAATSYPLITAAPLGRTVREVAPAAAVHHTRVALRLVQDDAAALTEALGRAASGEQVLWIENTVAGAQERYFGLASSAAAAGIEYGLLHSRFTRSDRAALEGHWIDLYGRGGWSKRGERGRILVGTQVLEQSLDIDSDFLVSGFAPTDMLLQRLGRLWRNAATPRGAGARCEAWLLAPQPAGAAEDALAAFGHTAWVYAPYVLCRSLEVFAGRGQVDLPGDIRALVEATYRERPERGAMAGLLDELENGSERTHRPGRRQLRQLALMGVASGAETQPGIYAQTRYSSEPTLDVLLLQDARLGAGGASGVLTLLDSSTVELPVDPDALSKRAWRALAAQLFGQTLPVPLRLAPAALPRSMVERYGLGNCFYLGDREQADGSSLLRVGLVGSSGALRGLGGVKAHPKLHLAYRHEGGYSAV